MNLSQNEFLSLIRRAVIGAGAPPGLAEDAAEAALWLAMQGLDGARAALEGLASASNPAATLHTGPSALDSLLSGQVDEVLTPEVDAPLLIIGIAKARGRAARWGVEVLDAVTGASVGPERPPSAGCSLILRRGAALGAAAPCDPAKRILVDPHAYEALQRYAQETLVPASDASRARGAGAGLSDAD